MVLRRIIKLLYTLISVVWFFSFVLLTAQPALFGFGLVMSLPALPLLFAFATAAPDASAGGFFLILLILIAIFVVCLVKLGLFVFRFSLYFKKISQKVSNLAPLYIGAAQILLTALLLLTLYLVSIIDMAEDNFLGTRGAKIWLVVLEILLLSLDTAFVYSRAISAKVTDPLTRVWYGLSYILPSIYVLFASGAGWRRLVALIQLPLFLFILQGFFLGHYILASVFLILLLLWGHQLRRSFVRKQEQLSAKAGVPSGLV